MEVVMGGRPKKNLRVVGRNQALHPYSHPRARARGGPKQRLSMRRTPCRMLGVVVTGSTKGVGLALAREFLKTGDDSVVICSRNQEQVDKAVKLLLQENPNPISSQGRNRVGGVACDVSKAKDVVNLREYASEFLGHVDIWVNNAGTNAYQFKPLIETGSEDLQEIVETNTLGLMFCMKEAINLMRSQDPGRTGHVFNMDGAGTSGSATPRFAAYGATKRAITQLNKSLQAELAMLEIDNVVLHMLSPGMVTTDLLMAGSDTKIAKFMINALAETPEEVAAYLVPRVRQVVLEGEGGGDGGGEAAEAGAADRLVVLGQKVVGGKSSYIKYLTLPKAFAQIALKAVFGLRNDRWVKE